MVAPYHTITCNGVEYGDYTFEGLCLQLAAAGTGPYDVVHIAYTSMTYLLFHCRYHHDWAEHRRAFWAAPAEGPWPPWPPPIAHDGLPGDDDARRLDPLQQQWVTAAVT